MSTDESIPRKFRITNIALGKGNRDRYIYALLVDSTTGEVFISATLDYILKAIRDRGYAVETDAELKLEDRPNDIYTEGPCPICEDDLAICQHRI